MKRNNSFGAVLMASVAVAGVGYQQSAEAQTPLGGVPTFRVDPDWPQVPAQLRLGDVSGVAIDAQDNAWILHRPRTLPPGEADMAAPAVVVFDSEGNFLKAWGGEEDGYEWPKREHGIYIDNKGFVWLGGNYCPGRNLPGLEPASDDQLLKFTLDGEFIEQFGRRNASRGNADTQNLHLPADAFVYAPTNELFIADGYGNHRVIVLDADTGAFKRMWGAFGNVPEDKDECPPPSLIDSVPDSPGPQQFSVAHAVRVSNDRMVYVADREHRRVQVFTLDGEYVDQIVWRTKRFARALALSPDPEQRFLYTGGGSGIAVLDRHTLEVLTTIDDNYIAPDAQPGRPRGFRGMAGGGHHIRADSQGNLYIAGPGARLQRLLFMGLSSTE